MPKNARRRESKGSQDHQPQLRNNNNSAGQQQQHKHNNERRSKWNKTASSYDAQARMSVSGEATGLAGTDDDNEDDHEDIFLEAAEWDSVLVPGSKKHNLNHLLNFHYAPRDRDIQAGGGGGGKKKRDQQQQNGRSAKYQSAGGVYNKDQFIQAK